MPAWPTMCEFEVLLVVCGWCRRARQAKIMTLQVQNIIVCVYMCVYVCVCL